MASFHQIPRLHLGGELRYTFLRPICCIPAGSLISQFTTTRRPGRNHTHLLITQGHDIRDFSTGTSLLKTSPIRPVAGPLSYYSRLSSSFKFRFTDRKMPTHWHSWRLIASISPIEFDRLPSLFSKSRHRHIKSILYASNHKLYPFLTT